MCKVFRQISQTEVTVFRLGAETDRAGRRSWVHSDAILKPVKVVYAREQPLACAAAIEKLGG